jgi:starch phosphorylase
MNQLYDRYLGVRWREGPTDRMVWHTAARIPGEELWRTHERRASAWSLSCAAVCALSWSGAARRTRRSKPPTERPRRRSADHRLRAPLRDLQARTLLLRDPDRWRASSTIRNGRLQIVFAGKAHPRDDAGKALIQRIVDLARQPKFRRRIVFVEDYDMSVTRSLVQGATSGSTRHCARTKRERNERHESGSPRGPQSEHARRLVGRSLGQHRSGRGALRLAIGRGETYDDPEVQDAVEAAALYELLEDDVVPCFYTRGADGEPAAWTDRMRASLGTLAHVFNTHRMVREYTERFYLPARRRSDALGARELEPARQLAVWRSRVEEQWPRIRVEVIDSILPAELRIDDEVVARRASTWASCTPKTCAWSCTWGASMQKTRSSVRSRRS